MVWCRLDVDWIAYMGILTKKRGLTAIKQAGGVDEATYMLKEGPSYPSAKGRIAETYRQLANGPMTGKALLDDLTSRNWLLPYARRPYQTSEFRQHLKFMVEQGRLHVLTEVDPDGVLSGISAPKGGLAFKVTYNDGGARGGLIGYRGVCSDRIMFQNVEVDKKTWCSNADNKCRQYCDVERKGPRPKVSAASGEIGDVVCYESELLLRRPFKFWTGTYHSGQHSGESIPINFDRVSVGDIALLTTVAPERTEQDRIVFGCYRIGSVGVDERGNYVESDGTMDLVLPDHIARYCQYWDYQTPNKDGSVLWGSGLFRYLDKDSTARFITDLVSKLGDTTEGNLLLRAQGDAIEIKPPQSLPGGRGGNGEGDEHRCLKELVAGKPSLIGLPTKSKATVEHPFLSGNRVDVKFDLPNGDAAVVEVETIVPLPGAHQAVMYRSLLEVERSEALGSGRVQAILVAHGFDTETRKLARKYGIKLVQLKA